MPCPCGGEALSSFHSTLGEKKWGLCCRTALPPAKCWQPPAHPAPAPHPSACQPGPGTVGTARLGKSPAGTRGPKSGVGRAGAPPAPGTSSVGRGGARFGAANEAPLATRPASQACRSPSRRLPAPRAPGGRGAPLAACTPSLPPAPLLLPAPPRLPGPQPPPARRRGISGQGRGERRGRPRGSPPARRGGPGPRPGGGRRSTWGRAGAG